MATFHLRPSRIDEETIEFNLQCFFVSDGDMPVELSTAGEFIADGGENWHESLMGLGFRGTSPPAINLKAYNKEWLTLGTFVLRKDAVPDNATFRVRLKFTQPESYEEEKTANVNILNHTLAITPEISQPIRFGRNYLTVTLEEALGDITPAAPGLPPSRPHRRSR